MCSLRSTAERSAERIGDVTDLAVVQLVVEGQRNGRRGNLFRHRKVTRPETKLLEMWLQVNGRKVVAAGDPFGSETREDLIAGGLVEPPEPHHIHEPAD